MRLRRSIPCLLLLLLPLSCASDSGDSGPEPPKTLSQRLNEKNGYTQDADGNWLPQTDKRSSFENQGQSAYFQGDYAKKPYETTDYSKKSWWGNKNYGSQKYSGNTDGSRFQTTSRHDGTGALETGKSAGLANAYQTNDYRIGAAREAGTKGIEKSSDAETDIRRRVYPAPEIIDYQQQRSLSLGQSKSLLGR